MARHQLSRRSKCILICAYSIIFTSSTNRFSILGCGNEIIRKVTNPKFGLGKGAKGHRRKMFCRLRPIDLWDQLKDRNDDESFQRLTRMYISEFEDLSNDLLYLRNRFSTKAVNLTFENKVLLFFIWLVKYVDYSVLSTLFGVSKAVIGVLIEDMLPLISSHFLNEIPDEVITDTTSSLSSKIIGVIDSTIHATQKPSKNQHLYYSDHYKRHGMMTTLLVDFDGFIISVSTGGMARLHDSMSSNFMPDFRRIVGAKHFALGDPGYAGVDYVVSGFKSNQLVNPQCRSFDAISRTEQVVIEHVNNFIKSCRVLSKSNQFHHSREKHINCVFIVTGWYNWMKKNYSKFS